MKRNQAINTIVSVMALLFTCFSADAQMKHDHVTIVGAMKNVMWKGQLNGNIDLDTISNKQNLYGLGPVEFLSGELLILNGITYKSVVVTDLKMKVEETKKVKAPFFGYANVGSWKESVLPDTIKSISSLEAFLSQVTKTANHPFLFRLKGSINNANIHIVNLPKGSKVHSPDDAHEGQKNYLLKNEVVEIVGFFSTEHKAIFTHHDTFLHMHLITDDRTKMGHLDAIVFNNGMKLYLPSELNL